MPILSQIFGYLNQKAEKWVSVFVLVGCCAITGVLVFSAFQAQDLGVRLTGSSLEIVDSY